MKKFVLLAVSTGLAATIIAGEKKAECDAAKVCTEAKELTSTCSEKGEFTSLQLKVSNVGCEESCGKLSKTLTSLKGVKKHAVCADSKVATIEYDKSATCSKTLTTALKKAGYQIEGQQVSLKVSGMDCGGCASKISNSLTSLKGVVKNDVCHESGTARILFDPEKVNSDQITAAITKAGYKIVN